MYNLIYNMSVAGNYKTFEEAFVELYKRIRADFKEHNGFPLQLLETAIWIEYPNGKSEYFYDARDRACRIGLIKDSKIDEEVLQKAINGS